MSSQLTLSLPLCHLKTTSKRMKLQILKQFCFLFCVTREKIDIKTHRTESTFVIGPGNGLIYIYIYTVCRRVHAPFSTEIFTGLGSEGVKAWKPE